LLHLRLRPHAATESAMSTRGAIAPRATSDGGGDETNSFSTT
jgi:hypothetical protein